MKIKIPKDDANDNTVIIVDIFVKEKSQVVQGEQLFTYETSKATNDVVAPQSGEVGSILIQIGDEYPVDFCALEIHPQSEIVKQEPKSTSDRTTACDSSNKPQFLSEKLESSTKQSIHKLPNQLFISSKAIEKKDHKTVETHNHLASYLPPKERTPKRKLAEINSLNVSSPHLHSTIAKKLDLNVRHTENRFFENSILDLVVFEALKLLENEFIEIIANNPYFHQAVAGIALDNGNNLKVVDVPKSESVYSLQTEILNLLELYEKDKLTSSNFGKASFTISDMSNLAIDGVIPLNSNNQSFIIGITKNTQYTLWATYDHRVSEGLLFSNFLNKLSSKISTYQTHPSVNSSSMSCDFCECSYSELKELDQKGFLKIFTPSGEKLICSNCYEGW